MQRDNIAETSVYRIMRTMLTETHDERGISVLSGPPGIGKTTAIDAFARDFDGQCLVVKVMPGSKGVGASPVAVLQAIIQAYCDTLDRAPSSYLSSSLPHLTREFRNLLVAEHYRHPEEIAHQRLTIVFDEAQYLKRVSIEMLRFWNDADRSAMPFSMGLVFVGNTEFALAPGRDGESVLSDAVRDRVLHYEELDYVNLSSDDLRAVAFARGVEDTAAVAAIIHYFTATRLKQRSLRQLDRIIASCRRTAGAEPITLDVVNNTLNPQ